MKQSKVVELGIQNAIIQKLSGSELDHYLTKYMTFNLVDFLWVEEDTINLYDVVISYEAAFKEEDVFCKYKLNYDEKGACVSYIRVDCPKERDSRKTTSIIGRMKDYFRGMVA